jgi:hypothetical protein
MSASATLALGQASYDLLEVLDLAENGASLSTKGSTQTLSAVKRGGEIFDIGIGGDGLTTLNVTDRSSGLFYADVGDVANPKYDSKINLLAGSSFSTFELGNGDNRFNAARDLTDSEVTAHEGDDTIRIGGIADGSFVSTGDGDDQFTANRGSEGLDVVMGEGDDTALFLGTLTAGPNLVTPKGYNAYAGVSDMDFVINDGQNIVDMGAGDDSSTFLGGVQGGFPGSTGYEIQLGAGYDTVVFGANSTSDGFLLNTGTGSDYVKLGRTTSNAVIDLGWDNGDEGDDGYDGNPDLDSAQGDLVVLGVGATLADSLIRSGQSNDELILTGTVTDTTLDLGWGNSEVDVFDVVGFSHYTEWDLGGGNDALTFHEWSDISLLSEDGYAYIDLGTGADSISLLGSGFGDAWSGIEFDLGSDGDGDTIEFGLGSAYSGLLISNFGDSDILIIGSDSYAYDDVFSSGYDYDENLETFLASGNEIRGIYYV